MKNRIIIATIAILCIVIGCNSAQNSVTKNGTIDNPWQLSALEQLVDLAAEVNAGDNKQGVYYIMVNDIDLQESGLNKWTAIGSSSNQFKGHFDGGGFMVEGLKIDNELSCQGFFGYLGSGGSVENLGVQGSVKGRQYIGGVVGWSEGVIKNCRNSTVVEGMASVGGVVGRNSNGAVIIQSYNKATILGTNNIGGVVGDNYGTISGSYNNGGVNGTDEVGGIVGWNWNGSTVEECYNTGLVSGLNYYVGGVVGNNYGTIIRSYNAGLVEGVSNVGGIVGWNDGGVQDSYNINSIVGVSNIGGVVGRNNGVGEITASYNTATVSGQTYVGGIVGLNYGVCGDECYSTGVVEVLGDK